ncbi:hypothetical protein VTN96DRAFT_7110 [Rasamsonia emersonii]
MSEQANVSVSSSSSCDPGADTGSYSPILQSEPYRLCHAFGFQGIRRVYDSEVTASLDGGLAATPCLG